MATTPWDAGGRRATWHLPGTRPCRGRDPGSTPRSRAPTLARSPRTLRGTGRKRRFTLANTIAPRPAFESVLCVAGRNENSCLLRAEEGTACGCWGSGGEMSPFPLNSECPLHTQRHGNPPKARVKGRGNASCQPGECPRGRSTGRSPDPRPAAPGKAGPKAQGHLPEGSPWRGGLAVSTRGHPGPGAGPRVPGVQRNAPCPGSALTSQHWGGCRAGDGESRVPALSTRREGDGALSERPPRVQGSHPGCAAHGDPRSSENRAPGPGPML